MLAAARHRTARSRSPSRPAGPAAPVPAAGAFGTRVEVRDLFFATPARLKFLKSERAETQAAREVVERLAMAHPEVAFSLPSTAGGRCGWSRPAAIRWSGPSARLRAVMGREFADNAPDRRCRARRRAPARALPACRPRARNSARFQHLFVNRRPVQDRLLRGALRAAYGDLLFRDRQPMAALFLELAPERVDVNVHPAKAEVRFREPGLVRGLVIGALRQALARGGRLAHLDQPRRGARSARSGPDCRRRAGGAGGGAVRGLAETARDYQAPPAGPGAAFALGAAAARDHGSEPADDAALERYPLGAARAQLHDSYILAQTATGCCWSTSMPRTSAWSTSA